MIDQIKSTKELREYMLKQAIESIDDINVKYLNELMVSVDCELDKLSSLDLLVYRYQCMDSLNVISSYFVTYSNLGDTDHNVEYNMLEDYNFNVTQIKLVDDILNERFLK